MRVKKNKEPKLIKFSPFVSHESGKNIIFHSGASSYSMSKEDAKWFRLYTICGLSAGRKINQFKKIKLKGAPSFQDFFQWAQTEGIAAEVSESPLVPSLDLIETALENALLTWKYGTGSKEFEDSISNRAGALTYLIETAWFVKQASTYIGVAVQSCKNSKVKKIFKKLYDEEKNHYKLLLKDLGLSEDQLNQHDPSPNARSFITYLQSLAAGHPLRFALSFSLLEADRFSKISFKKHLKFIRKKTKLSLRGFEKHFNNDLNSNHTFIWKMVLKELYKELDIKKLNESVNSIHVTRHQIMAWQGGIAFRAREAAEVHQVYQILGAQDLIREPFTLEAYLYTNPSVSS